MSILYPLRDPISDVEVDFLSLSLVEVTLTINGRKQRELCMTPTEAREFLSTLADDVPAFTYDHHGARVWNLHYTKTKLVDGQGNLINIKDL